MSKNNIDNRRPDEPVFGEEPAGSPCLPRPGAYAVVLDQGRLAVVQTARGYFLPGGGSGMGEEAAATLRREVREECGCAIDVGQKIGEAVEYVYAAGEQRCYRIEAAFFEATLGDTIAEAREPDHRLVWLEVRRAIGLLNRKSQVWVVQRVIDTIGQ